MACEYRSLRNSITLLEAMEANTDDASAAALRNVLLCLGKVEELLHRTAKGRGLQLATRPSR